MSSALRVLRQPAVVSHFRSKITHAHTQGATVEYCDVSTGYVVLILCSGRPQHQGQTLDQERDGNMGKGDDLHLTGERRGGLF